MKFGMRKPSLKRSLKARTTGRAKRAIKKAIIPGYGRKGAGWIKNPKKALYNKVYHKTTFSLADVFKFSFKSKNKRKSKSNSKPQKMEGNVNMEEKIKVPFYKKKWFLILISLILPVAGIVVVLKSKGMNKILKGILTAVASFWSIILLAIGFVGNTTEEPAEQPESTTAIVEESTTFAPVESATAEFTEESTTEVSTTEIAEESTTASTTQKETTTEKATTTSAPTTTKKVTTTASPTTTKKVTTTAAPTTTKKVTTTAKPTTTKTNDDNEQGEMVWIPEEPGKYHKRSDSCGMKYSTRVSVDQAKRMGYEACKRCY